MRLRIGRYGTDGAAEAEIIRQQREQELATFRASESKQRLVIGGVITAVIALLAFG